MGSPLGLALINIFVKYCEEKLFSQMQKPPTYFRYVDNTFTIFNHEAEADEFLTKLNYHHSSLKKRKTNVYCSLMFMSKE